MYLILIGCYGNHVVVAAITFLMTVNRTLWDMENQNGKPKRMLQSLLSRYERTPENRVYGNYASILGWMWLWCHSCGINILHFFHRFWRQRGTTVQGVDHRHYNIHVIQSYQIWSNQKSWKEELAYELGWLTKQESFFYTLVFFGLT